MVTSSMESMFGILVPWSEAALSFLSNHQNDQGHERSSSYRIISMLPIAFLVACTCYYTTKIGNTPRCAQSGTLRWGKTAVAMILTIVEYRRVLDSPNRHSFFPFSSTPHAIDPTAFIPLMVSLCLTGFVNIEHIYTIQPSAIPLLYLSLPIATDIIQLTGVWLPHQDTNNTIITIITLILRLSLVILQEIPKSSTTDNQSQVKISEEKRAGYLTRTFSLWIYSTLVLGFYATIGDGDLIPLGPQFSSKNLLRQFKLIWGQGGNKSTLTLGLTCLSIIAWPTALATIGQICNVGFKYASPLVVRSVIVHIMHPEDTGHSKSLLVFSAALTFIGFVLSRFFVRHSVRKARIMLRSALIALLVEKNINLATPFQQNGGVKALISDVDLIVDTLEKLNVMMVNIPDTIFGLFCLHKLAGVAIFPYIICKFVCGILSVSVVAPTHAAAADWDRAIQVRTSFMASVFAGIKATKMMGLEKGYSAKAQDLRNEEIEAIKLSKRSQILAYCLLPFDCYITTGSMLWGCFYWKIWPMGLDPSLIFPTLLTDGMLYFPFLGIAHLFPRARRLWADLNKICNFMALPEYRDHRVIRNFRSEHLTALEVECLTPDERSARNRCIALQDLSVAPAEGEDSVLEHLQISINFGTLTIVSGRTGSGKSILLKALLGEVTYTKGWAQIATTRMAYCDQNAWLPNVTIQEAVIGEYPFDPERYKQVVRACCLEEDDNKLDEGENDKVGTNVANLSGSQKQRLALARAVYSDALIILADEVLSLLDINIARAVFERVFGSSGIIKKQGRTAILATHSAEWVQEADLLIHLDSIGGVTTADKSPAFSSIVAHLKRNAPLIEPTLPKPDLMDHEQQEWDLAIQEEQARVNSPHHVTSLDVYRFLLRSLSWKQTVVFHCGPVIFALSEQGFCHVFRWWAERDTANAAYATWTFSVGIAVILQNLLLFLYIYHRILPTISVYMHDVLLDSAMSAPLPFLTSTSNTALLTRSSQDMTLLSHDVPFSVILCIYSLTILAHNTVYILFAGIHSLIIILLLLVAMFALQHFYARSSRQVRLVELKSKAPLYEKIRETTHGLEHIRSFGWTEATLQNSLNLLDQEQRSSYYMGSIRDWRSISLYICSAVLSVVFIWALVMLDDAPTVARVGLGLTGMVNYAGCPDKLLGRWANVRTSLRVVERLKKFVEKAQRETDDGIDPAIVVPEEWPSAGDIEFQNVSSTYDPIMNPHMVLEEVSFSVEHGHKLLVAGKTGSGKSSLFLTLLKCIPYSGSITIDGIDICNVPRERLRQSITTIPQDGLKVPEGTVRDILFPYDQETKQRLPIADSDINSVLATVGLFLHVQDNGGHDATLSSMQFSVGQLQLLNVARAILHHKVFKSKIVLMDEITSSLDIGQDCKVNEIVKREFEQCTVLVISHRKTLDFTGYDSRLTLRRGRLLKHVPIKDIETVAEDTHTEVEKIMIKKKFTAQSTPGYICGAPDQLSESQSDVSLEASVVSVDTYQSRQADAKTHQLEVFLAKTLMQLQMQFQFDIRPGENFVLEALLPVLAQAAIATSLQVWRSELNATEQEFLAKMNDAYAAAVRRDALQRSHDELIALLKSHHDQNTDVSSTDEQLPQPTIHGRPGTAATSATEVFSPQGSAFDPKRVADSLKEEIVKQQSLSAFSTSNLRDYHAPENSEDSSSSSYGVSSDAQQLEQDIYNEKIDGHNTPSTGCDEPVEKRSSDDSPVEADSTDNAALQAADEPAPAPPSRSTPYSWARPEPAAVASSSRSIPLTSLSKSRFTPLNPSPLSHSRTISPPSSTSGSSSSESSSASLLSNTTPVQSLPREAPRRPLNYAWTRNVLQLEPPEQEPRRSRRRSRPKLPPRTAGNRSLFGQIGLGCDPASQLSAPSSQRETLPWWQKPVRDDSEAARREREEKNMELHQALVQIRNFYSGPRGLQPIYQPLGPAENSREAATIRRCRENGFALPRCWVTARTPFFWVMHMPGVSDDGRPPSVDPEDGAISDRSILSTRRFFINDLLQNKTGSYEENQELLRRIQGGIDLPTGPGYETVQLMLARQLSLQDGSE